jgi:hypothetical protein
MEDNIKMELKETERECGLDLSDRDQFRKRGGIY